MEELVLALALVLVTGGTAQAARASRGSGGPRAGSQLVAGALGGTAAAIVVAVPYADVVPDGVEPALLVGLVVALALLGGAWLAGGIQRRRRSPERRAVPAERTSGLAG